MAADPYYDYEPVNHYSVGISEVREEERNRCLKIIGDYWPTVADRDTIQTLIQIREKIKNGS